jgi:Rrf2 family transcriptional regulator, iron-sulfur cluster assembly transcription factor
MRLSTKSRYGVRAIFDIAYYADGLPMQIKKISKRQGITPRYLEQIFQKLKRAGIVKSIRGPKGGYILARKPDQITIRNVIQAVDESIEPVLCAGTKGRRGRCRRENHCVAQIIWREAGDRLGKYFDSITLGKMCQMAEELGIDK